MEFSVNNLQAYAYTSTRPPVLEQPTLLFIHGAAMDHSVWILQSRYFAYHNWNVLAVDLPGHGRSEGSSLPTIAEMADWLAGMLSAVGVKQAALVGHSMGSLVALELAARRPDIVSALALCGVAVPMTVGKPLLDAAQADDPAAVDMIVDWGHSPRSHFGGNRAPGLWMAGEGRRLLERAAAGVLYNDLNACNDYRDGLDSAKRVRCPTLFVLGGKDMMTPPRAAKDLAAAIADSRAVQLSGCGHMMMYERPDETLDALIDFLDTASQQVKVTTGFQ